MSTEKKVRPPLQTIGTAVNKVGCASGESRLGYC